MKTDKQIYRIFAARPQWLFELSGLESPGKSKMESIALKALEQTADGVVVPDDWQQPVTVVEFQFQNDPQIYTRTAIQMAVVQQDYQMRKVQGIIFFRYPAHDPRTEPWTQVIASFSLRQVLTAFEQSHPNHPLPAVFKPIMLSNENTLEERALEYYRTIKKSKLEASTKTALMDVFVSWLEQRFPEKGKKEIEKMLLGDLPDLRDTQSGKDLIDIGRKEGRKEGEVEAKRKVLTRLLERRFGKLSAAVKKQIRRLDSSRKLDSILDQVVEVNSLDQIKW